MDAIVRIRQATALALAVPGVSFLVHQMDWPSLLVGWSDSPRPEGNAWRRVCPRRFRSALIGRHPAGDELLGPFGRFPGAVIRIEMSATSSTEIDRSGMFTICGGRRSATGFVVSSEVRVEAVEEATMRQMRRGPPRSAVSAAVDVDLGTQVIAWWYRTGHSEESRRVRDVARASMATATVDELLYHVTAGGRT